jgi:3-oxoacyl-[acyl-carrier-protein] synthase-3
LGCSGYIYGLWICSGLIATGCKRVLLLAGETASRMVSPNDRTTVPLFGDAGTATALESDGSTPIHFQLGTDGAGYKHLIMPAGTSTGRLPHSVETMTRSPQADTNIRGQEDLFMNGAEVFAFTLREVPPMISELMKRSAWTNDEVDRFFLHQANEFMLVHLARRMGLPPAKVPMILKDFGNTSSASIPLTITLTAREILAKQKLKLVLAGFGVGLSWGACALEMESIVAPALVEVP